MIADPYKYSSLVSRKEEQAKVDQDSDGGIVDLKKNGTEGQELAAEG